MAEAAPGAVGNGLISEKEFAAGWRAAFDLTGEITKLQSLKISEAEVHACDEAAGGVYAVARKHPSLHWLLRTDGAYVKLALGTLPFVAMKGRAAVFELRARRAGDAESPSDAPA